MTLLSTLGLPPLVPPPGGGAKQVATSTRVPPPQADEEDSARSSSSKGGGKVGVPSSKVIDEDAARADQAAIGQEPLGQRVDGPDAEQLYALLGRDGNVLDASNSKAGAHLNELGESLSYAFGRDKDLYDAWQGKFDAVMRQSSASATELKKMQAAKKAFVAKADWQDDVSGSSDAYLRASAAVKKAVRDLKPKMTRANAAFTQVRLVLAGKEARSAQREEELRKQKYEERKEEIKEQQERIKGALGLMTKFASVTEWTEIIPEALAFADEQLLAELPKAELEQLKKNVEKATAKLHEAQDKQDSIALGQAYELLDAANQEFDNAQEDLIDRAKELARSQNHVIKKLESNEATRPAADVIAASRKMTGLMATAAKAGEAYLAEGRSLIAECERTAVLYAGYPSIVAQNKTLVSSEIDSMSRSAKTNVATLKTWIAYMRSVDKEVEDGVEACKDKSDKGYMKNYNQVGPLLEAMLSGH